MHRFYWCFLSYGILGILCCFPPHVFAQNNPADALEAWRQEWFAYEREIQAWCAKNAPTALATCVQEEMAKHGVSPAFFATLRRSTTASKEDPKSQIEKSETYKASNNIFISFQELAKKYHWNKEERIYPCGDEDMALISIGRDRSQTLMGTLCMGNIKFNSKVKITGSGIHLLKGTIMTYPK